MNKNIYKIIAQKNGVSIKSVKKEIEKAFEKLEKEQLTTEELIREGLMFLGR